MDITSALILVNVPLREPFPESDTDTETERERERQTDINKQHTTFNYPTHKKNEVIGSA